MKKRTIKDEIQLEVLNYLIENEPNVCCRYVYFTHDWHFMYESKIAAEIYELRGYKYVKAKHLIPSERKGWNGNKSVWAKKRYIKK